VAASVRSPAGNSVVFGEAEAFYVRALGLVGETPNTTSMDSAYMSANLRMMSCSFSCNVQSQNTTSKEVEDLDHVLVNGGEHRQLDKLNTPMLAGFSSISARNARERPHPTATQRPFHCTWRFYEK